MNRKEVQAPASDRAARVRQSHDCIRQRSLHRAWWNSARIALRRGHSGEPPHQPNGPRAIGTPV